ncbi:MULTISPECIES: dihydroxyacetone kinase subunit DhaL [Pelosinus]|uniref:phosphoenolpyruvate--glycerone phosphotransferase n=1 Tax=Pelosinus fermentans B4 TaxID=1149862 RepID=I9B2S1_9FIRM|nr:MULTISPECIES: dihydroxyacetone kinase subunit DhaL [Pelosinus]EIW19422.1 dihydroxyacetone kinase, L subunit [Pelosinus fermentans B4]EIW24846.1 dihydroxyacetone kinase, L subunit [Pelosinus fermentans A11]OAM96106.1 dihydroxyacetone kinase, L subunit [Pelosinus fermentans DSM 17108]SDR36414.1 dihydroxyacetone kinase DhaL subunit [Pelosinus fermentans]
MYDNYVLGKKDFIKIITALAAVVEEKRDYLSDLDSPIGDGDHGFNLSIGFREVMKNLSLWEQESLAIIWEKIGMAILGKVGGSAGPLYGSFFLKFGEVAQGKEIITFNDFYAMFSAGIAAIEMRGKAVVGEKTMVDALRPGIDAFADAMEKQIEPLSAFSAFVEAADRGAKATIPIIAKKGRAMRLGERAIGHIDPGAVSATLFLQTIYKILLEKNDWRKGSTQEENCRKPTKRSVDCAFFF